MEGMIQRSLGCCCLPIPKGSSLTAHGSGDGSFGIISPISQGLDQPGINPAVVREEAAPPGADVLHLPPHSPGSEELPCPCNASRRRESCCGSFSPDQLLYRALLPPAIRAGSLFLARRHCWQSSSRSRGWERRRGNVNIRKSASVTRILRC